MRNRGRDPIAHAGILIDPPHLLPLPRIGLVRCDEMEALRINADRMPELRCVAADNEVERLDLLGIGLAFVERRERLEHVRAANGDPPHGDALLEAERFCG